MNPEEIKKQLRECEHLYAEYVAEGMGGGTLRQLWEEIRRLRHDLRAAEEGPP